MKRLVSAALCPARLYLETIHQRQDARQACRNVDRKRWTSTSMELKLEAAVSSGAGVYSSLTQNRNNTMASEVYFGVLQGSRHRSPREGETKDREKGKDRKQYDVTSYTITSHVKCGCHDTVFCSFPQLRGLRQSLVRSHS